MAVSIPLSKNGKHAGKFEAIIDDCDSDLAELRWNIKIQANRFTNYAARGINLGKAKSYKIQEIKMHRVILERTIGRPLEVGEMVDHINGNGLDNRRENLRLAIDGDNVRSQRKRKDNISGYKGVTWDKDLKKWRARITYNSKLLHLGSFGTPQEAHEAYCNKAKELFGEFARFE